MFIFSSVSISQSAAPWGLDVALLSEAHGLVTDLLLETSTMPPQLASGLKALANLLSPPLPQYGAHGGPVMDRRPRHTLPHVALSDVQYASDTEEIPYTGETLLHLSKVNWPSIQPEVMCYALSNFNDPPYYVSSSPESREPIE